MTADAPILSIDPPSIDLGAVSQCNPPPPIRVVLRNNLDRPQKIAGFVSTCGCTIPDVEANVEIQPGGELVVNIRLELWGRGRKQQFIRFVGEHSMPLGRVQILYEVDSSLRSMPSGISRDLNPEGSFDLESTDNHPFTVTGAEPPAVSFPQQPAASDHAGRVSWEYLDQLATADPKHACMMFDKAGRWSAALIKLTTSKADCPDFYLWVKNSRAPKPATP